ncbi:hypothetical protein ASE74_04460 [Pedobacter sp. Leaf216]|uniref:BACON domain-containing protein n=1 Tax=Pedobacter sp. Leaf216 TaxID=1735684 RepID=UPI0006FF02CE|nr:BACON domain-containing carbohydrate-binding protein [Pedobacter sp. Leaf216]KQM69272.1 hypothetical protein ASE74_04460 [Pedobacter sp. Leaf216]
MKKKINPIITFVIVISLLSCKKQNIPLTPVQSDTFSATIEDKLVIFPATKNTASINIIAGTNGWSLTQNTGNSWLVADKNFGAGDYKLRVTLNANATGAQRTTVLRLVSTNSNLPAVLLNITQDK